MNLILQYEQGYISFSELESELWNFGPNSISEVGENCFKFYIHKACSYHEKVYFIEEWSNGIKNRNSQQRQNP